MVEGTRRRLRRRHAGAAAVVVCIGLAALAATGAQAGPDPDLANAGPAAGIVYAHGQSTKGHGRDPQLIYHLGGTVMTSGAVEQAIFWGPRWGDSSFAGDKISGLDSFYQGVGGSSYLQTTTEYTDPSGHVSSAVTTKGHVLDSSATPGSAPSTSDVLAVVARNITNPVTNGYYPVYSDQPRGNAGYCAWHSWGYVGSTLVQFAFFFSLDGDSGCDPQDSSGSHSEGLSALANVSGHELSEALTDPHANAWYDRQGAENADKCAWTFGHALLAFKNGTQWKIQGNWSNNAYTAGTGYTSGTGCIDGG